MNQKSVNKPVKVYVQVNADFTSFGVEVGRACSGRGDEKQNRSAHKRQACAFSKLKRKPSKQASFCSYSEVSFCSSLSLSRNSSGVKTGISDAL